LHRVGVERLECDLIDGNAAGNVDVGEPEVAIAAGHGADVVAWVAAHLGEQPVSALVVEIHGDLEVAQFVLVEAMLKGIPARASDRDVVLVLEVFAGIEVCPVGGGDLEEAGRGVLGDVEDVVAQVIAVGAVRCDRHVEALAGCQQAWVKIDGNLGGDAIAQINATAIEIAEGAGQTASSGGLLEDGVAAAIERRDAVGTRRHGGDGTRPPVVLSRESRKTSLRIGVIAGNRCCEVGAVGIDLEAVGLVGELDRFDVGEAIRAIVAVTQVGIGHLVDAFGSLGDRVAGAVARVHRLIAKPSATVQAVVATRAGEDVVAGAAGNGLGEFVSGQADARAGSSEVLDMCACGQDVVDTGVNGVAAATSRFDHAVVGVVDHIGVVAAATGHDIRAATAVEHIGPAGAGQGVRCRKTLKCGQQAAASAIDAGQPRDIERAANRVSIEYCPRRADIGYHSGHGEVSEPGNPVNRDGILCIAAADGQVGQRYSAGHIIGADADHIAAILDAAQLDGLLRAAAIEVGPINGQILIVSIQEHVPSAVGTGVGGTVIGEITAQDFDVADRVTQCRRRTIAGTDVGKAVLHGVFHIDVVEDDGTGKCAGMVTGKHAIRLACGVDAQVAELQLIIEFTGTGDLTVDDGRVARAVDGDCQAVCDGHVFRIRTRRNVDGVAADRFGDRRLDGGVDGVASGGTDVAGGIGDGDRERNLSHHPGQIGHIGVGPGNQWDGDRYRAGAATVGEGHAAGGAQFKAAYGQGNQGVGDIQTCGAADDQTGGRRQGIDFVVGARGASAGVARHVGEARRHRHHVAGVLDAGRRGEGRCPGDATV